MKYLTNSASFLLALASILVSGCSTPTSVPMSAENTKAVKTVYFDRNVPKPKTIFWRGTAQAWGAVLGGAVGGAIVAGAAPDAERIMTLMAKESIDISELVSTEVSKQIASGKSFQLSDVDKGDSTLRFSVDMYGFNKTHPLGSNMNPIIRITGKLTNSKGELVWQESEHVSDFAFDNDQGQPLDTYLQEPAKLRAALAKIAQVAVKRVVAKLP